MSDGYKDRFSGLARLYGESGLTSLHSAHVAVIGIGGVGSWSAEALARSGIGEITLVDLDDVCITNTNRQQPTTTTTTTTTTTAAATTTTATIILGEGTLCQRWAAHWR